MFVILVSVNYLHVQRLVVIANVSKLINAQAFNF